MNGIPERIKYKTICIFPFLEGMNEWLNDCHWNLRLLIDQTRLSICIAIKGCTYKMQIWNSFQRIGTILNWTNWNPNLYYMCTYMVQFSEQFSKNVNFFSQELESFSTDLNDSERIRMQCERISYDFDPSVLFKNEPIDRTRIRHHFWTVINEF